jgi:outer membrane receptor protein involved in Fe transport
MKRVCCLIILIAISHIVFAQNGKISGKVISANSGQPLAGASLTLVEKTKTRAADQNGIFSFSKLEAGTYSIKCSYAGYESKIIEEVIVKDNDNTDISISLDIKASDEVVVKAPKRLKAAGATVESLLIAQKNSASVSDGVTEQTIKRTPDKSSSDVIKRVSGASIQDDKFAVIRGLNDRYNAAFINGAPLPSTESDRKAFAFDIFPSAILENLIIYKTATPDKSGEFAGGIIEITTKSSSTKPIASFSISQGYNSLITGNKRLFSEMKGANDWLGLDDGTRALPDGIPADKNGFQQSLTPDERLHSAKSFGKYKWGVKTANTRPNFNFQLAKSFNILRKKEEFISSLFSMTYNRGFTFVTGERNSYEDPGFIINGPITQIRKYTDSIYNDEVIWAVLGNIGIKINNRNNISWKNNLSVNTDNKLVRRIGNFDVTAAPDDIQTETLKQYTSDKIYTSQLIGEHQIGKVKTKINWLAAYSKVNREIPIQLLTVAGVLSNAGSASNGASGGMISTNSQENIKNTKIDIAQPYTFMKNTQNFIKIGAGYQIRKRDFTSRGLNFVNYTGNTYQQDVSIFGLPDDQRFLGQYLGVMANGKAGISVQDGSIPNSEYIASSTTSHAYIMNDQRFFKKIRMIYGVRMESFNQKLVAAQRGGGAINLNYTKVDFLPSANLVYALTPKTNLRASYSETLNRPEFRELASFSFYEYVTGLTVAGDSTSTRAKINNYDFRYEFYPGKAQLLSVSAFYKNFINPIELINSPTYPNEVQYSNQPKATVYGVEAEFRVILSTLFGNKNENGLLSKFTLAGNGALMKSKVPLGKAPDSTELSRPLQGQSPYIINASLAYSDEKTGLSSTLSLNRIGEKLVIGGSINKADIYDKERTVIDFQLAKTFYNNKVELKFNIRDLLAQNIITYFDYDRSRSFTEQDRIFSSNISPRVISFTGTFKF